MIRAATRADIDNLVKLSERFTNETAYGWTFSPENARKTFKTFIDVTEQTDILAILIDDECQCGAILEKENLFQVERLGYITKFYVMPDVRGSRLSLDLLYASLAFLDDCAEIFAADTSLIENSAYKSFLTKRGFEVAGAILRRVKHG